MTSAPRPPDESGCGFPRGGPHLRTRASKPTTTLYWSSSSMRRC